MYVLTYIIMGGNHTKRIVTHVFRMRCHKTDTHIGSLQSHAFQQHRESNSFILFFKSIGIYILSQQGHFLKTLVTHIAYLIQDTLHIAATLTTTGIGYNTISTEIIASAHDRHKTGYMHASQFQRHDIFIGLLRGQFHIDCFFTMLHCSYQIRQIHIRIRSDNQVCMMHMDQFFLHPFGHTPQYTDNQRLLFTFKRLEIL